MYKMRILLTGGGGMVGKNFLEHPAISDFEMIAPRSAELDLRDAGAVQAYLYKHRPDMIIHSAGKVGGIQANIRELVGFLLEPRYGPQHCLGSASVRGQAAAQLRQFLYVSAKP